MIRSVRRLDGRLVGRSIGWWVYHNLFKYLFPLVVRLISTLLTHTLVFSKHLQHCAYLQILFAMLSSHQSQSFLPHIILMWLI